MKNIPTIFVIFGATGDLMRKKLAPALFNLYKKEKLPSHFKIIAFSRRNYNDEDFQRYIEGEVLSAHPDIDRADFRNFLKLFSYVRGDFNDRKSYLSLSKMLRSIDDRWGVCTNKLFYLAVAPELYKNIFTDLAKSGLTKPCSPEEGWTRVIVEKPFGQDFTTARKLDELLAKLFREVQIYRIDHYLAKEMLQNILAFRFFNNLLEKNWSNESIEKIDIKVWEKIGVEQRGKFYDAMGALRDVGQNHLLQMLALTLMDLPRNFTAEGVRSMRAEILKTLKIPSLAEIKRDTFRAQYDGYRSIEGVNPKSAAETYFKIRAFINTSRWAGIPVTMESGKRMGEARKEITVLFKHPQPCLCLGAEHHQNKVVFSLEPEERITIHFWSKKPGLDFGMEERTFEFLLRDIKKKSQYVEEYEKLLLDCVAGDQTLFISTDEVNAMWKFIDPIVHAWEKNHVPLKAYKPDTAEIAKMDVGDEPKIKTGKKEIGIIGLGKMGMNLAERLLSQGWRVAAFDTDKEKRLQAAGLGIISAGSLEDLVSKLSGPKLIWLMVPAGKVVDDIILGKSGLIHLLKKGDAVVDGGNSFFEDTIRRAKKLKAKKITMLDAGISGGPEGARQGASIMVGGDKSIYEKYQYLFHDLSLPRGFGYMGRSGAGHFVKMVHNGIEYGMMQAIAEGYALMRKSPFHLDFTKITEVYNHGSVIESRLLTWLAGAFEQYGSDLKNVSGKVGHSGEGEWTVKTGKKLKVPLPVIRAALAFRLRSKKQDYIGKTLSGLRNQFGGHDIKGK